MDLKLRAHSVKIIVLVLLLLLALGGYLVFAGAKAVNDVPISTPATICYLNLSNSLFINQTSTSECASAQGGWVTATVTTTSNSVLTLWAAAPNQTATQVYSAAGQRFHVLIPLLSNGTLTIDIANSAQQANKITGTMQVFHLTSSDVVIPVTGHPYRDLGLGLAIASGAVLLVILLDPAGVATSGLERIKGTSKPST